jgi:hypothetical protein
MKLYCIVCEIEVLNQTAGCPECGRLSTTSVKPIDVTRQESNLYAIRASKDYVPEFPPSRLIDDSVEGCVSAYNAIRRW